MSLFSFNEEKSPPPEFIVSLFAGDILIETIDNMEDHVGWGWSIFNIVRHLKRLTRAIIRLRPEITHIEYRIDRFTTTVTMKELIEDDHKEQSTYKDSLGY